MENTITKIEENEDYLDILSEIAQKNDPTYNLAKLAEECSELATVCCQMITKPTKVELEELSDELGDVFIRLVMLIESLPEVDEKVGNRVEEKITKYSQYLKEGKFKNI